MGHRNDVIFGLDVCSVTTSLASASKGICCRPGVGPVAEATVVYIDRGVSPGMKHGIADAEAAERPVEHRLLAVTRGVTPTGSVAEGSSVN